MCCSNRTIIINDSVQQQKQRIGILLVVAGIHAAHPSCSRSVHAFRRRARRRYLLASRFSCLVVGMYMYVCPVFVRSIHPPVHASYVISCAQRTRRTTTEESHRALNLEAILSNQNPAHHHELLIVAYPRR